MRRIARAAAIPYAAFGASTAAWQVLLAELALALDLSPATLGASLTLGGALSLPAMLLTGRLADRRGPSAPLAAGAALAATGLVALALATGTAGFVAATLGFLVGFGVVDVAVNARAVALEQGGSERVVAGAYAAFSAGALAATLVVGAALAAGVDHRVLLALAALPLAVVLVPAPSATRRRRASGEPRPAGATALPAGARGLLLLLAGIVALAFVVQGTLEQWTTVYLRTGLGLDAGAGWTGLAAFHAAMLGGRLAGLRAHGTLGREALLRGAGLVVAFGMGVALATTALALVLLGVLLCGLACGLLAPAATSLAGEAASGRAGAAASALATAGYGTALLAPAVVGGLADATSLRAALALLVLAGLGTSVLGARVLARS